MRYELSLAAVAKLAEATLPQGGPIVQRLLDLIPPGELALRPPVFAEGPPTMSENDLDVVRRPHRIARDPGLPLLASRNALVLGYHYVVLGDSALVFNRFGADVHQPDLSRYPNLKRGENGRYVLEADDAEVDRLPGRYVLAYWEPARMYHHWLLDCLPRAVAAMTDDRLADAKLLLPRDAANFVTASLLFFGIPPSRIAFYDPARVCRVDELLMIPIPRYDLEECGGAALSLLREAALPHLPPSPYAGRCVIFSRRDAMTGERLLINEDAVVDRLLRTGAVSVELTAHSVGEQLSIAHHASMVVCVHGSAGANLLFCSPSTRVLHLFPDCVHYFYTHGIGTSIAGAPYAYLYGPSFQRALRYHNNPWLLSPERVVHAVDALRQA